MGMQRVGPKKVRKLNALTQDARADKGIGPFIKIGVWSDPTYAVGVTENDEHWTFDRRTGQVGERDQWRGKDVHWSSCHG